MKYHDYQIRTKPENKGLDYRANAGGYDFFITRKNKTQDFTILVYRPKSWYADITLYAGSTLKSVKVCIAAFLNKLNKES